MLTERIIVQSRLSEAIAVIRSLAATELKDPLEGRGKYSKLSKWMSQKLAEFGEGEVSDQSVSNWWSGRIGANGLDDQSARKLGLLLGFPRVTAAQLFKLYLLGQFDIPPCDDIDSSDLKCCIIRQLLGGLPHHQLLSLRSKINCLLSEGAMCRDLRSLITDLFEEDEFVYRMPAVSDEERQRYRDFYRGSVECLSDFERGLIIQAVERETNTPIDLLNVCSENYPL